MKPLVGPSMCPWVTTRNLRVPGLRSPLESRPLEPDCLDVWAMSHCMSGCAEQRLRAVSEAQPPHDSLIIR